MSHLPAIALPFREDAILAGLTQWAACESPTWDAAAVNRMMDLAGRELALMGARIERIPGRMGLGDCVRARFPHAAPDGTPGLLVLAHLDTVHPIGTLAHLPIRREGNRVYGPGICDMKGGTYLAFEAIRQILRAGLTTPLPLTVLLTSDEEIGSPSTRDLIEAEAARNAIILVPEPARPDGGVVTGRYAIARFNLRATGRPSQCRVQPIQRPQRHPRDVQTGRRHRSHDDDGLHLLRRCHQWRPMGQLRRHPLQWRGAEHGQTPIRS